MTKFKIGDKFVPRKPKDKYEPPSWVEEMDEFDGKVLTVSFVNNLNNICTNETTDYTFSPDWCEKVEDTHIPDVREIVGSLELPNNQEHIVGANKMVDWDYWRNEFAKSAMQGLIVTNWNIYEVPNLVGKSIEIADEMIKQLKQE